MPRLVVFFVVVLVAGACRRAPPSSSDALEAPSAEIAASSEALPPLMLADDTPDILLTWIDEQGDFHVVQKVADVPEAGRAQVRVVQTTLAAGTGTQVYVADLRARQPDGRYPLRTLSRAEWNMLGADRRKVRLEALAPTATASVPAEPGAAGSAPQVSSDGKVHAIVYGASWCKPCHDAERFLKQLGVDVVKKDVEVSRVAQAEMEQKLARVGRMGASIPVIDLAGRIFVGYNPDTLKRTVAEVRGK